MRTRKYDTHFYIAAGVLFCFSVVFAGLIAAYVYKFDQKLTAENHIQLAEVSSYIATHMTTVVADTQEALTAVSSAVALLDSDKKRMEYLRNIVRQYSFVYMGYADEDGLLHSTIDSESVNVSHEPYFRNAIRGTSTVSDQVRKIFTNRAVSGIVLAVPCKKGNSPGVLIAMLETRSLRDALSLESFGGAGYAYLIDKKGTVVMRTKSLDFGNLFVAWKGVRFQEGYSLAQLRESVAANRDGITSFSNLANEVQYAYHQGLPFNNWTVVTVVSENAVASETMAMTRELAVLGSCMVILFMGLMFWSMRSRRLSQESKIAADAKSAFLANMSHEIRTPMNAIVGLSEIMLRDEVTPKHRDQLTSILNSGKGLLSILNDILDISKIESGKFAIIEEPYGLESLLYDLTIIVVIRIGEKPLQFLVELAPNLPRQVMGDMGRVKQILLNIVGNAIKFTESGSIRLIIDGEHDEKGWLLHMEVRDTGIGIRPDDLDKMFVRFSQVDTRRNRNVEGTGLGLTISQTLCEMMGGNITVTSEYGKGTSFKLTIRQGDCGEELLVHPVQGSEKLLLHEENPLLREFEAACMDKLNVPYTFCDTSEKFTEKLRQGGYTHALAPRNVLRQINISLVGKTHLVGLLSLREHSLLDSKGTNVYLPLFLFQLSYALRGASTSFRSKHAGVDKDMITPMPHVSVLIVDDNELNIMVAEGLMAPYDMQLHHVYSGRDALRAVQNQDFDMVLMDHMMPEMDGVETTRRIRELPDEKYRQLPIIALTANTTSEARQLFLDNGFNEFLAKPIETTMLNKILRDWLKDVNNQRAKDLAATRIPLALPVLSTSTPLPDAEIQQPAKAVPSAQAIQSERIASVVLNAVEVNFGEGLKMMPSQDFYIKILKVYVSSTSEKLAALPEWMHSDQNRVVIEVHGLKSASASIGALFFSEAAKQLEIHGKMGDFDKVKTCLPGFIEQGHRVLAEVEAYLAAADPDAA